MWATAKTLPPGAKGLGVLSTTSTTGLAAALAAFLDFPPAAGAGLAFFLSPAAASSPAFVAAASAPFFD